MKSIILALVLTCIISIGYAQKINPEIKDGTTLSAYAVTQGTEIEVNLTLSVNDNGVGIKWVVLGFGEGAFQMSKAAVENGKNMFAGQPAPGVTTLGDNDTFGMISKSAFKALKEQNAFVYNNVKFVNKSPAESVKINGQDADVLQAVAEQGGMKLWILNNPEFPIVVQSTGMAIDLFISDIK